MAFEGSGRRKFTQLVSHHVLGNVDGNEFSSVVHSDRVPYHLRNDGRSARPGFDDDGFIGLIQMLDLLQEMIIQKGSLFY